MERRSSDDKPRLFIRPVEEIPPDVLPSLQEKTDIHGRTIAQLEEIIARAKRVVVIMASYKGAEEYAKRLERARGNIEIDEGYLAELKRRPDDWPRDGCDALAFALENPKRKRAREEKEYDEDSNELELDRSE